MVGLLFMGLSSWKKNTTETIALNENSTSEISLTALNDLRAKITASQDEFRCKSDDEKCSFGKKWRKVGYKLKVKLILPMQNSAIIIKLQLIPTALDSLYCWFILHLLEWAKPWNHKNTTPVFRLSRSLTLKVCNKEEARSKDIGNYFWAGSYSK